MGNRKTDLIKLGDKPKVTNICPICGKYFYKAYIQPRIKNIFFIHTPRELAEYGPINYCNAPLSEHKPDGRLH